MHENYRGIVPYLFVDDAEEAIAWYTRVFGFEETGRWTNDAGQIQNAELKVGDTEVWLDGGGRRQETDERPQWVGIWVKDVDAVYDQVRSAGVDCEAPVDREFGVRMLNVSDGMGYLWGFVKRLPARDA